MQCSYSVRSTCGVAVASLTGMRNTKCTIYENWQWCGDAQHCRCSHVFTREFSKRSAGSRWRLFFSSWAFSKVQLISRNQYKTGHLTGTQCVYTSFSEMSGSSGVIALLGIMGKMYVIHPNRSRMIGLVPVVSLCTSWCVLISS